MRSPLSYTQGCASLALCAVLATAAAQQVQRLELQAGDEWRFVVSYGDMRRTEPNRIWIITSVDDTMIVATENGEPLSLTPELNVL